MNRDDVIRWAREAGLTQESSCWISLSGQMKFAALVAAAEREACAKVCEAKSDRWATVDDETSSVLQSCASAIRARTN